MLGELLNNKKKSWYLLAALVAVAALLAGGMMAATTIGEDEASAESSTDPTMVQTGDAISVKGVGVDASQEHAAALFACKVEDIKDSASVAILLETMELEAVTGKYVVQIAEREDGQVMALTMELPVEQTDEAAFNDNMEKYVQQMLALIPQLDKVEWIYSVKTSGGEEQAVGSLDDAAAAKALGRESDWYGKSEKNFGKLLTLQTEGAGQK